MKEKGKYEGKVVAFDFDGTITSKEFHSHNYLLKKNFLPLIRDNGLIVNGNVGSLKLLKKYNPSEIDDHCVQLFNSRSNLLRNPEDFLITTRKLMEEGAKIAIVSFNQFPAIVDFVLKKIGFSKEEIEEFDIILGFPLGEQEKIGKSEHLEKLKELTGVTQNKEIILVDDSYYNISKAQTENYSTIYVNKNDYFIELMDTIENKSDLKLSKLSINEDYNKENVKGNILECSSEELNLSFSSETKEDVKHLKPLKLSTIYEYDNKKHQGDNILDWTSEELTGESEE